VCVCVVLGVGVGVDLGVVWCGVGVGVCVGFLQAALMGACKCGLLWCIQSVCGTGTVRHFPLKGVHSTVRHFLLKGVHSSEGHLLCGCDLCLEASVNQLCALCCLQLGYNATQIMAVQEQA
jgi:hypothetical protein